MKYALALVTAVSLIGAAACNSASTPTSPSATSTSTLNEGRSSLPTIAGIATSDANFSTLVSALVKANLVDTFNGDRHFTVFAPTNAAFDAAATALGYLNGPALISALDVPTLTAILQYHVTLGDRNAQSVLSAGSLRMLDGNSTTIEVMNGNAYIDNAMIVATDIRASNGIVHVIDGVILPPTN